MTDDKHKHEFSPGSCPGCASYADRYRHSDLAANLDTEDRNLDAAKWQSSLARPAADPAADVTHPVMHDDTSRRPRESINNRPVRQSVVLGRRPRPTTESRIRPSDEDQES